MNLPTVSLRFDTKSQKLSVTHECLSADRSAATNLLPTMTSALPFHCAGRTETGSADTRSGARRRSHPQHLSASAYRFFYEGFTCGSPENPPRLQDPAGPIWPAAVGREWVGCLQGGKSVVNAQLKMNIRREINVAYERFPSYLKTESLASYSG